ncbi:hypothetical protein Tco_0008231 [Tanacetum coccineum]
MERKLPLSESRNPYVLDEDEGLPSPPVDDLAFLNPYSMSLDLSKRRVQTHETIVAFSTTLIESSLQIPADAKSVNVLLTNFRLLKELVALEKANKLDAERKKDVDVKVASASLLQKKQELAVTQTEVDMSPENQAKKAFAMSKGMFTYPSLAARSLVRDIGFGPVSVLSCYVNVHGLGGRRNYAKAAASDVGASHIKSVVAVATRKVVIVCSNEACGVVTDVHYKYKLQIHVLDKSGSVFLYLLTMKSF